MLIILAVSFLIGLILFFIGKIFEESKFHCFKAISEFALTEFILTLIFFTCFNLVFSATIQFTYATGNEPLYMVSQILAIGSITIPLLMAFVLTFIPKNYTFGEFKKKFKNTFACQSYFTIMLLYRTILGVYMASMN